MNSFDLTTAEIIDMADEDYLPRKRQSRYVPLDELPAVREYNRYMAEQRAKRHTIKLARKAKAKRKAA